jgi:hypothetical protein
MIKIQKLEALLESEDEYWVNELLAQEEGVQKPI